jgi:hypothetical protein
MGPSFEGTDSVWNILVSVYICNLN